MAACHDKGAQLLLRFAHDCHRIQWGRVHVPLTISQASYTHTHMCLAAGGKFRLGDFGLAINASKELPFSRSGTLDYMAPEVSGRERASAWKPNAGSC
jgi:hypothetical protein